MSDRLQTALLRSALEDPRGGVDVFGRPRRVYNAVAGVVFVGMSTNEPQPAHNCYPVLALTTELRSQLLTRADRSVDEALGELDE